MKIDLHSIPFSRRGSYIAFNHVSGPRVRKGGLYLRSVRGLSARRECLRLELFDRGEPVDYKETVSPSLLRLEAKAGHVDICFAEPKVVRVRGEGVGLCLSADARGACDNAIERADGRWQINLYRPRIKYMLTPLDGMLAVDAPWRVAKCEHIAAVFLPDARTGTFACAIEEVPREWKKRDYSEDFDDCCRAVEREFQHFLKGMPKLPPKLHAAGELLAYNLWSSVVAPDGLLRRQAVLMSKLKMTNVWSWDNCFNAMALAYGSPDLAWDQFMTPIDHQDETGVLPDSVNDATATWNFCKPPIHGWALRLMMKRTKAVTKARLREAYGPLWRLTDWWFDCRDDDGDGVPQYNHGNDSGWDNATIFDAGAPVEAPDLSAFLVIQMDVLSEVAALLGRKRDAARWKQRAGALLKKMLEHSWRGDRFVAPRSGSHHVAEAGDSLLPFVPIVLGKRLPKKVRDKLVAGLRRSGRFLTRHGPATESPKSDLYEPDGYWRGPIWAPATMILVEGLAESGQKALAHEISRRFCKTVARSGPAENFDALTGQGLRDRAYTWTSSVFLVLAHEYLRRAR
jgi:hypothetical protein